MFGMDWDGRTEIKHTEVRGSGHVEGDVFKCHHIVFLIKAGLPVSISNWTDLRTAGQVVQAFIKTRSTIKWTVANTMKFKSSPANIIKANKL